MYVFSIIQNSILYMGFTYMYISCITFRMVLSTWLHTTLLYESLDNVFAPFQKFVLMFSQNNLLSQQFCKVTLLTYDLGSIWNFGETWTTMSTTISQNFSSFNIIEWKILLLPWNHLKLRLEHKMTYNSFSTTPNSLKFWETYEIYVFYVCSKFQLYWWWPQRVITFKRN
jgi:hypothetical protein